MTRITVIFIMCIASAFAKVKTFGPFHVKVFNVTDCGEDGPNIMHFDVKLQGYNDSSSILDANVKLPKGFGNDVQVSVDVDEWRNNVWVEKVYTFYFNQMCNGMKEFVKETFTQVTKHLKIEDKCPVASGTYTIKEFMLTLIPNVKEIKYGTYKCKLHAHQGTTPTGCLEATIETTPKNIK
ncbi:uncharacterized protein LOC124358757 [Homalodisca vitripennis]|nr:uncharacterized protein LOC124358757 [Homalodisca vitripennis]KAG8252440.1 hypothetical protein J6590_057161 [Homalodisca vitripennis]